MTEPPPIGSREELRAFIGENLGFACVHVSHAIDYAELGQDALLGLAVRNATSHFKAALETYHDLCSNAVAEESA